MRIRKFNEEVGFDDEETRDRLEIPNLKGELEPSSPSMKTYSLPQGKISSDTEIRKIIFREPILDRFRRDIKRIEGSKLISFFATSKEAVDGSEFYAQLSFAYHDGQYYIGTIIRNIEDHGDEEKWVKNSFFFDDIQDVYKVSSAFIKVCERLNIVDKTDLDVYRPVQN